MKWKELEKNDAPSELLVFDTGDEVIRALKEFAQQENIVACRFEAFGAFERVILGYYDLQAKVYRQNFVSEQVEVLSLIGNITISEGLPKVHAHVSVGRCDGTVLGGHLLEGRVRPTLELMMDRYETGIFRRMDTESGLALIDLTPRSRVNDSPLIFS